MEHVMKTLQAEHPEIKKAFFRQDNAGCYHSATTITAIPALSDRCGISIGRIDFSDPQGGKGPCDRVAAAVKSHIRHYVNEGNDVTDVREMEKAILSGGGVSGVRAAVVKINTQPNEKVKERPKLEGVSRLSNFCFEEDGIRAWRAYEVGRGKLLSLDRTRGQTYHWFDEKFSEGDFKPVDPRGKGHKGTQEPPSAWPESVEQSCEIQTAGVFACPQEGCVRVFQRYSSLENHLSHGKCVLKTERVNLIDRAKRSYARILHEGSSEVPALTPKCRSQITRDAMYEGWALRPNRKGYRFNVKQKNYLELKFNIGQESGQKATAEVVAKDMRRARDMDGKRLFSPSEFLTEQQVTSFFSRLAAKVRQHSVPLTVDEDALAVEEKRGFRAGREAVLASFELASPNLP